jgi:hypothetical protein
MQRAWLASAAPPSFGPALDGSAESPSPTAAESAPPATSLRCVDGVLAGAFKMTLEPLDADFATAVNAGDGTALDMKEGTVVCGEATLFTGGSSAHVRH